MVQSEPNSELCITSYDSWIETMRCRPWNTWWTIPSCRWAEPSVEHTEAMMIYTKDCAEGPKTTETVHREFPKAKKKGDTQHLLRRSPPIQEVRDIFCFDDHRETMKGVWENITTPVMERGGHGTSTPYDRSKQGMWTINILGPHTQRRDEAIKTRGVSPRHFINHIKGSTLMNCIKVLTRRTWATPRLGKM